MRVGVTNALFFLCREDVGLIMLVDLDRVPPIKEEAIRDWNEALQVRQYSHGWDRHI